MFYDINIPGLWGNILQEEFKGFFGPGQKPDFNKLMEEIILGLEKGASLGNGPGVAASGSGGEKPGLLLQACCAPCSTTCIERLFPYFKICVFFYNPNIYPFGEYSKRLDAMKRFIELFSRDNCLSDEELYLEAFDYREGEFEEKISLGDSPGIALLPERGERCRRCYSFRLEGAFAFASERGFDYVCSTLTLSPYKNSLWVNEIGYGLEASGAFGVKYLPSDFKKKNGYLRSIELCKKYSLYRQDYCGCRYGLENSRKE